VLLAVHNIVTCGLRARIVETEETAVARQRVVNALAAADNTCNSGRTVGSNVFYAVCAKGM
jgi:hypothetical protein